MGYIAFYLYGLFLFIRPQDWWLPFQEIPIVTVTLLVASMAVFLSKKRPFSYPQVVLILCFIFHVFLSSVANGWLGGGVFKAEKLISSMFLPVICGAMLVDSAERREKLFKLMIYAAIFMVFNGVTQVLSEEGYGFVGSRVTKYDNRITYIGILNDPNDLGMYFVMLLPIIAYFVSVREGISRAIYLLYGLIILLGIYLTNSRGTLVGVIALLAVWHLFHKGIGKTMVRAIFVLPVLFFVLSKFRQITTDEDSASGRLDAWYAGLNMLMSNPLFGVGQGNFWDHHNITAHNSFVLIYAELGIPGYFLWISILLLTLYPLLKLFSSQIHPSFSFLHKNVISLDGDIKKIGNTLIHVKFLFYSMAGYLATAFFLSRSYTPLLYVFIGLCISCIEELRHKNTGVQIESFQKNLSLIMALTFGSIFSIWLLTKMML